MRERGVSVDHTAVFRWGQRYAPELDKCCRRHLTATHDATAAERFFQKALRAKHTATPRVITVEKNAASPPAFETRQQEGQLPASWTLRPCKYGNNVVEQDYRFLTRRVHPGLGCGSFRTAQRTMQGYEAM